MSSTLIIALFSAMTSLALAQSGLLQAHVGAPMKINAQPPRLLTANSQLAAGSALRQTWLRKLILNKTRKIGKVHEAGDTAFIATDARSQIKKETFSMDADISSPSDSKPDFMTQSDYQALVKMDLDDFDQYQYKLFSSPSLSATAPMQSFLTTYLGREKKPDSEGIRFIGSGNVFIGLGSKNTDLVSSAIENLIREFLEILQKGHEQAPESNILLLDVACGLEMESLRQIIDSVILSLTTELRAHHVRFLVITMFAKEQAFDMNTQQHVMRKATYRI